MPKESTHIFDHIVYGASIPGIVYALNKMKQGQSVLLLNHYGFPGGCITESLACRQYVHANSLTPHVSRIFEMLLNETNGTIADEDNAYWFDPEVVKMVLQEVIESSNISLLFHVLPLRVGNLRHGETQIELSAKEGIIHVTGRTVFDATDEQYLSLLSVKKRPVPKQVLNVVLLFKNAPSIESIGARSVMKLSENRYWASFDLSGNSEEKGKDAMQEAVDTISERLAVQNGKIQLLPVRPGYAAYPDIDCAIGKNGVSQLTNIIQKTNPQHFVFANAVMLETRLNSHP
jgi:hypothetical protein